MDYQQIWSIVKVLLVIVFGMKDFHLKKKFGLFQRILDGARVVGDYFVVDETRGSMCTVPRGMPL